MGIQLAVTGSREGLAFAVCCAPLFFVPVAVDLVPKIKWRHAVRSEGGSESFIATDWPSGSIVDEEDRLERIRIFETEALHGKMTIGEYEERLLVKMVYLYYYLKELTAYYRDYYKERSEKAFGKRARMVNNIHWMYLDSKASYMDTIEFWGFSESSFKNRIIWSQLLRDQDGVLVEFACLLDAYCRVTGQEPEEFLARYPVENYKAWKERVLSGDVNASPEAFANALEAEVGQL